MNINKQHQSCSEQKPEPGRLAYTVAKDLPPQPGIVNIFENAHIESRAAVS